MSLAIIWHYWIGVVLFLTSLAVLALVGTMYFVKVVRPKYPPRR